MMATKAPTVLPLNAQFTAFKVLLPIRGREFVVGVHDVPSPKEPQKSLSNAKLDCSSELRNLLTGFEHLVQESIITRTHHRGPCRSNLPHLQVKRLNQSMDVAAFVEELKDILERIMLAQPEVNLPPASFYARVYSDIEAVGWEHVAWLAPSLTSFHLRFFDQGEREHIVQIQLPSDYPVKEPTCNADLPVAVELLFRSGGSMKDILSQYELAAEQFQDFWTVMEDIDKHVWVMEPEHPSRANCFRRIALGGHCSLCITVDPFSPRVMPAYRFFGSDLSVAPFRQRMEKSMDHWKMEKLLRENLENVLDMKFPGLKDADREDVSSECIICYSYRLLEGRESSEGANKEGSVPDRVCDNGSCGRPFHTACLAEWLRSLPTTRQSFDVLFGACPHCSHPTMVKCSFS